MRTFLLVVADDELEDGFAEVDLGGVPFWPSF